MSYCQMSFNEIDFGGGEKAEHSVPNQLAVIAFLAKKVFALADMEKGTLTDRKAAEILDWLPTKAGELSFRAALMDVNGHEQGDYDVFCAYVRRRIRAAYAEGKVRYSGQKRNRKGGEK